MGQKTSLRFGLKNPPRNRRDVSLQAPSLGQLNRHVRSSHERPGYPCDSCDFSAARRYQLAEHVERWHGGGGGGGHPCGRCDQVYSTRTCLRQHVLLKHGLRQDGGKASGKRYDTWRYRYR